MRKINQHNPIFTNPPCKVKEVPGYPGYYAGMDGKIYSCFRRTLKALKPFAHRREQSENAKLRVSLTNDKGAKKYVSTWWVFENTFGQEYWRVKAKRDAAKREIDQLVTLGELF